MKIEQNRSWQKSYGRKRKDQEYDDCNESSMLCAQLMLLIADGHTASNTPDLF